MHEIIRSSMFLSALNSCRDGSKTFLQNEHTFRQVPRLVCEGGSNVAPDSLQLYGRK